MVCLARIITFHLLFEFTKCRELSDTDGNFIPRFQGVFLFLPFAKLMKEIVYSVPNPAVKDLGFTSLLDRSTFEVY